MTRAAPVPPTSRHAVRRQRELDLRREDVLTAASEVFASKGFHAAQVSEIAQRAEVSLASVYQLFLSKEALFEAVTLHAAEAIEANIRGRVDTVQNPVARVLEVLDAMFACFDADRDLLRIYTRATNGLPWRTRGELGERTHALMERFATWVIDVMRQAKSAGALAGLDPEIFASALIGAVVTSASRAIESDDPRALARAAKGVRALFERALAGSAK